MSDESDWKYPYPTQFLGGPDDVYAGVVDYDGETLRVAYRPVRRNGHEDKVRFDFQGEGPLILTVEEARRFLYKANQAINRGEEKIRKEREDGINK